MSSRRCGEDSTHRPIFFRIPAVIALFAQLIAFCAVVLLAWVLPAYAGIHLSIAVAALMQGVFAAMLVYVIRLAPWWFPIQFFFPIAVVVSAAVQLPPLLYFVAFFLFLVLFWSTFRTQVPFYPSNSAVWHAVEELLPKGRPLRIIDVGSGFGGMVIYLARMRPESEVVGVELAPLPWICSRLRGRVSGSGGLFVRRDYYRVDFREFDVVFAYLSPAAMPALWRKAHTEMRKGTLLLSYEFAISGVEPTMVVQSAADGPALYGWRIV